MAAPPDNAPDPVWRNFGWVTAASVVNRLISLLTLGYGARVLGPEGFGLVGWAAAIVAYAAILISPGMNTWGTRRIAQAPEQAGDTVTLVNITQVAISLAAYAGLWVFTVVGGLQPLEQSVLLVSGLALLNYGFSSEWAVRGLELMHLTAAFSVFTTAVYVAGLFAIVRDPSDLLLYPALRVGTDALAIAFGYWVLFRNGRVRLVRPQAGRIRSLLRLSAPLAVTAALVTTSQHINTLVLKTEVDATQLGLYMAAFTLFIQVKNSRASVGTVFLPYLTRLSVFESERSAMQAGLFARAHVVLGLPMGAWVFAEADTIVAVLYGSEYLQTVPLLRVLSVAIAFNFVVVGYTAPLVSFGEDGIFMRALIASTVISVGGAFLLTPALGVLGAAIAVAMMDVAAWLIALPGYRRVIGSVGWSNWLRGACAGILIVLLTLGLREIDLVAPIRLALVGTIPLALVAWEIRTARTGTRAANLSATR